MTRRLPLLKLVALAAYLVCIALVASGMVRARKSLVQTYGSDAAQANWQQWRDAAQTADGLVERREPQSDRPPALVLMQDHFNACLGFSLLMTTVLFFTVVFMIRGAFFYEQPAAYQTDSNEA